MIDEDRQDLAIAYVLGALDPRAEGTFEAALAEDAELRAFTNEMRDAAAGLAHTASRQLPPPELRERILSTIRAEAAAVTTPSISTRTSTTTTRVPEQKSGGVSILPWAIAAGFALSTGALWFERDQLRTEYEGLRKEAVVLRDKDTKGKERIAALNKEVDDLKKQDDLAQVRIASLTSKLEPFANASAVIVWDAERHRGVVKLVNVPPPASGKDYQLWVIDEKRPEHPVSAGVVPMAAAGATRMPFTTTQPIEKAQMFAISVEPAGGMPKPTGDIVLTGN
jgi:anti-sigma-K factor RskA